MKYFGYFLLLAAYIMGSIGGIGYAVYEGAWPIAVCLVVVVVMAFPVAEYVFKDWVNHD